MSEMFSEGDLVEATKGDRRVIDRVVVYKSQVFTSGPYLGAPSLFTPSSIQSLKSAGYTLTLIEKATPPLPTEPGIYRSRTGAIWIIDSGKPLRWVGDRGYPCIPHFFAPFDRLEPVAETAKKVLDRVDAEWQLSSYLVARNTVAKEFGATS